MVDLTIGGGNFKGLAFLGALEYLHSMDYLNNIENFYGCSVGSMIGILYIIGFTPRELLNELLSVDFSNFWDPNLTTINTTFSLLSTKLFDYFRELYLRKESDITIKEFVDKYSVNINILTVSIKSRSSVIFNAKDYPDVMILNAIIASCSIPFIFPPVKIDGEYYIDGCTRCSSGCPNVHTRGYVIKLDTSPVNITNFTDYINEIFMTITQNEEMENNKNTIMIKLPETFLKKIDFGGITDCNKVELFYIGLKQAAEIFSSKSQDQKLEDDEPSLLAIRNDTTDKLMP